MTTSSHTPSKKQRRDDEKSSSDPSKASASLVSMTRRRVWRACESCRRKKIKCDGVEPICGQCTQTNSNCTWIQTRDRAALSRQYVQELENRVIRLEAVLAQVAPQVNLANLPTGPIPLPQGHVQPAAQPQQLPQGLQMPGHYPTPQTTSGGSASVPSRAIPGSTGLSPPPPHTSAGASLSDVRDRIKSERTDTSDEFVIEQMGTLALDDHGHLRWIGGSSTMSLIEAFRNFSASEDKDSAPSPPSTATTPNPPSANLLYFPTSLRFGEVRALPGPDEVEYPPLDLADKLVEAYFEKFHHTLPVLDQRSFRSKYQRLMDARRRAEEAGDASMGTTKSDAGFICVVFAVYAVAARFVDDDRLKLGDTEDGGEETGGMGMVYYERALVLYYIGAAATQLAHVQAFVLLSSFLASLNCLPQAWLLCGQAVRIAQDLGLHRSPKHLVMSPINKETRRKVWWCVYGLDRMLAVALGRPLGVEDSDCDVELPLPIDDVDLPTHFQMLANAGASPSIRDLPGPETEKTTMTLMAGFNALTQLYIIVGRVLRTVYAVDAVDACKESQERTQRQVAQLDKELMDWCERLPSTFKSDPKSPQQISLGAVLCSSYYSALITLHRNFLPTKRKGVPNPNWASVPKAVFASRSCILLSLTTKDSIPRSHHLAFFVQALFGAAVIILLCARFATVESAARTASDEVNTALVCLGALEGAWPGAKKCREMLEELVEATRRDMKVQVPGVGRPGSVNGLVAPTPPGVDKVQTVYQSYKRAANEGGEMMDEPGDIGEEKPSRKIKAKPRRSVSTTRRRFSESSGSPASGSASVSASGSVVGQGDAEMDYLVQDHPTDGYQTVSGAPNFAMTQAANSGYPSSLAMSAPIDASSPQALMNIGPTATSDLSSFGQQIPSTYNNMPPHDWLPSPVVDSFNMTQFNSSDIFSNLPLSANGPTAQPSDTQTQGPSQVYSYKNYELSPGSLQDTGPTASLNNQLSGAQAGVGPSAGTRFEFNGAEIPFSGFDFLQNFSTGPTGTSMSGFGATDVAVWQNFVQTGVFNDVPDQPFALAEGGNGAIVGEADD